MKKDTLMRFFDRDQPKIAVVAVIGQTDSMTTGWKILGRIATIASAIQME